jgi:hypothetical protein
MAVRYYNTFKTVNTRVKLTIQFKIKLILKKYTDKRNHVKFINNSKEKQLLLKAKKEEKVKLLQFKCLTIKWRINKNL